MTAPISNELISRAAERDPAAAEALLRAVRPGVVRYCRARLGRIGGAYTSADDVAQEVCLALLRALPRYRDLGRPFTAFVYGIAAHKVADAQRAAVRDSVVMPVESMADQLDAAPGPEQQAIVADLSRRLGVLLAQLPDVQREIVTLRVAVGLTSDEVAEIIGMTAAAVRVAQSRALARLRTLAGKTLNAAAA